MNEADLAAKTRAGDGLLTLTQDDARKQWYIQGVNDQAAERLGYTPVELQSLPFDTVLGKKTSDALREIVEFEPGAPDLADAVRKIREFRLKHRLGDEFTVPVALSRVESRDNLAWFQLVLPNEREQRSQQQMRDFLKHQLEGSMALDPITGIPDRETARLFYSSLQHYLGTHEREAAFAVLRMDRHPKALTRYGTDACVTLLKHVINCCRSTFRADDVVCVLNDHMVAVFLPDLHRDAARVVLNRLRWLIRSHRLHFGDKSDFSVTVSIAFSMLSPRDLESSLEDSEDILLALDQNERNQLIELGQ
jgi:diguanylate cyclase (GGDEF)-like protein